MKPIFLFGSFLAYFTVLGQTDDREYFITWKTNESGEKVRDSIIKLSLGEEVPKGWEGRAYFIDENGKHVSKDGKFEYYFREDEKTGELFLDSIPKDGR